MVERLLISKAFRFERDYFKETGFLGVLLVIKTVGLLKFGMFILQC